MIGGLGLQWQASFTIITLLYFYSHYLFASGAAHIGAMYTAFLSVSIAMGTPPLVVRPFLFKMALNFVLHTMSLACFWRSRVQLRLQCTGQGYLPAAGKFAI